MLYKRGDSKRTGPSFFFPSQHQIIYGKAPAGRVSSIWLFPFWTIYIL